MAKADELGLDVDVICEQIESGKSLREIAEGYELIPMQLTRWVANDALRSARVREAREESAYQCDDLALATLKDESIEVARAREIASHYRWRAKTRKPREFGDKQEIDLNARVELTDDQIAARIARLTATSAA